MASGGVGSVDSRQREAVISELVQVLVQVSLEQLRLLSCVLVSFFRDAPVKHLFCVLCSLNGLSILTSTNQTLFRCLSEQKTGKRDITLVLHLSKTYKYSATSDIEGLSHTSTAIRVCALHLLSVRSETFVCLSPCVHTEVIYLTIPSE